MLKFFTFLLTVLFVSTLSAQKPETGLNCTRVAPVIGGEIDAVWGATEPNAILLPFKTETPTLGNNGETWWKGLWTNDGIYLLAYVTDDDYYPYYAAPGGSAANMYDQIEWYFDCNYIKLDGVGASPTGNAGHYQIACVDSEGKDDGTLMEDFQPGSGIQYAYNASDAPNWWHEIFIPWTWLKDQNGYLVDISIGIGFDVTVIDGDRPNDNARQRAVSANDGLNYGLDESLNNMDGAGLFFLIGCCFVYSERIILTGGNITENDSTLQIGIEIFPVETTDKTLKWIIQSESTAKAKISSEGVVTPISNGILKIKATSSDGYIESNEITINISGQIITIQEVNWLVDGFNEMPNENGSPNDAWARDDGLNSHTAFIEDGVFHFSSDSVLDFPWSMNVRQHVSLPVTYTEEEFLIVFKMWAAEETSFQLVLEDRRNNWAYWGTASGANTPNAVPNNGNTRWDLTVTTEPAWFKMHFIPSNIKENSNLDFCFQPGLTGVDIYLDSLYLFTVIESESVDWYASCLSGIEQNRLLKALNVYPNPATDLLTVRLEKGNTTVAIYNSVGIKMDEIRVEGTQHVFDVSNYGSGLYFVKANNTVVKFVK